MRYKVCSIRDRAGDVYSQPMFFNSIGSAVRTFSDEVKRNHDNNQLFKHPEDFDLYQVGEWDDELGEFITMQPKMVAVGKDHAA